MKSIIKRVLKALGIYKPLSKVLFNMRYGSQRVYHLKFDKLALQFNTEDDYSKRWFYPRYAKGNIHEPAIVKFLCSTLTKQDTFIDVGANLGYFTCVSASLSGQVYAIEMDPKCIALIKGNAAINHFTHVQVINAAVSDVRGKLHIPNLNAPNPGLMLANGPDANTLSVDALVLDEFVRENQIVPTFFKIDAEGAEFKILTGMKELLARGGFKMLVEVHCDKIIKLGATFRDVLSLLERNGWAMQEIIEHRDFDMKTRAIDATSELSGNVMIFATKGN